MGGARCLVEAEREASSAETDDQNKEVGGAEHELSANEQILSGLLRNVKRISVAASTRPLQTNKNSTRELSGPTKRQYFPHSSH